MYDLYGAHIAIHHFFLLLALPRVLRCRHLAVNLVAEVTASHLIVQRWLLAFLLSRKCSLVGILVLCVCQPFDERLVLELYLLQLFSVWSLTFCCYFGVFLVCFALLFELSSLVDIMTILVMDRINLLNVRLWLLLKISQQLSHPLFRIGLCEVNGLVGSLFTCICILFWSPLLSHHYFKFAVCPIKLFQLTFQLMHFFVVVLVLLLDLVTVLYLLASQLLRIQLLLRFHMC